MVKKLQTELILKVVSGCSFASNKTISAFADTDLQLMIKMVAKSNACTSPSFVTNSQNFYIEFVKKCDRLEKYTSI